MYQEKVDVAILVDAAPAPVLAAAAVERQETDALCNLRKRRLNCWRLGTLQDNVSKDATTIEHEIRALTHDGSWLAGSGEFSIIVSVVQQRDRTQQRDVGPAPPLVV